jgi:predicted O-methyltransferase YrrM
MRDLVEQILSYENQFAQHRGGTFRAEIFRAIAEALPDRIACSVETGTGKSTVLFSNVSAQHTVFTIDDRAEERSSVALVPDCPLYRPERVRFVYGPTQRTLPTHVFDAGLDVALIDGPHGYPFPELEYYFIYPHLNEGALLILDDVHIPTIGNMFAILREDAMFQVDRVVGHTAFLRRTAAPTFDPCGDGWWQQHYNVRRFSPPGRRTVRSIVGRALKSVGLYAPARGLYHRLKANHRAGES